MKKGIKVDAIMQKHDFTNLNSTSFTLPSPPLITSLPNPSSLFAPITFSSASFTTISPPPVPTLPTPVFISLPPASSSSLPSLPVPTTILTTSFPLPSSIPTSSTPPPPALSTVPFSPAFPAIKQPATAQAEEESNPDSESLFSPSQGYSLTAIVDTVLVLVLLTFVTVCFLQWREGKRRQRRREDLERECQAAYVVEVPLEEYGRRVERVDYQFGDVGGSGAGVGGRNERFGMDGHRHGREEGVGDGDVKGGYKFEEVAFGR